MGAISIPAELLDFLRAKQPSAHITCGGSYWRTTVLELAAEREVGASVGILELVGVHDLPNVSQLVDVQLGAPDDVPAGVREEIIAKPLDGAVTVVRFRADNGQMFACAVTALYFTLKPWLDLEITQRLREKNAALGHPAQRVVQTWLRPTEDELFGQEIPCNYCLQTFRFAEDCKSCPHCGRCRGIFPPENFLLAAFHRNETLLKSSGCTPLHLAPPGVIERYRLICYSYWLDHKVVEVERTTTGASLRARYWHSRSDEWVSVAERPLTAAEWRRLAQLVDLAPFWDLPPYGGHGGFDGADYLLEGLKEGHYHYVKRWCPNTDGDDENFVYPVTELLSLAAAK